MPPTSALEACPELYNARLTVLDTAARLAAQQPGYRMKTVNYYRVSTAKQGRSGLGLAAQRIEIEQFGKREGFSVRSWYHIASPRLG